MALETLHHDYPPRGLRAHRLLIAFAVLAIAYCVGAPLIANLLANIAS
jgi:hypothetical protein